VANLREADALTRQTLERYHRQGPDGRVYDPTGTANRYGWRRSGQTLLLAAVRKTAIVRS
jgi:hypothetical protein